MTAYQKGDGGMWEPAKPLGYQPGLDVEWYGNGTWEIFRGAELVAEGRGRLRLWWRMRRLRRGADGQEVQ